MGMYVRVGRVIVSVSGFIRYTESTLDLEAPAAPTTLAAVADGTAIDLTWDSNTEEDFAHYNVYRDTATPVDTSKAPIASIGTSAYRDESPEPDVENFYVVKAADRSNNLSAASNEASATPGAEPTVLSEYDVLVGTAGATVYPDPGVAYPSAEGYGRNATGGRTGTRSIQFITSRDGADVAGSVKDAFERAGPRYIIPLVWGYVDFGTDRGLDVEAAGGDFTYFGQFMPFGQGLILRGTDTGQPIKIAGVRNAIFRYFKAYRGQPADVVVTGGGDAMLISFESGNIMIGNSAFAFGVDETLNLHQPDLITVHDTWVIESIHDATHTKGDHGKGTSIGHGEPRGITLLRAFYALHDDRSPVMRQENNQNLPNEYVNSYTFNHDIPPNFTEDQSTDVDGWVNIIKNVVENGPAHPVRGDWAFIGKHGGGAGQIHSYLEGNIGPGRETDDGDQYAGVNNRGGVIKEAARIPTGYTLREIAASEVKATVLDWGGPSYVRRQTAGANEWSLANVRDDLLKNNVGYADGSIPAPDDYHSSRYGDAGVDTFEFPAVPVGGITEAEFWSDYYNPVATAMGWPLDEAGALSNDAATGLDYIELYMLMWVPDFPTLTTDGGGDGGDGGGGGGGGTPTTDSWLVQAGGDDGEFRTSNDSFSNSGVTMLVGQFNQTRHAFVRFSGVTIPQGATVTAAELRLVSARDHGDTIEMVIHGVNEDNAAAPTTFAEANGEPLTVANVPWSHAGSVSGAIDTTPDLTAIVQEIVNRAGWASGNAMMFQLRENGNVEGQWDQWRTFENGAADRLVELVVTYEV